MVHMRKQKPAWVRITSALNLKTSSSSWVKLKFYLCNSFVKTLHAEAPISNLTLTTKTYITNKNKTRSAPTEFFDFNSDVLELLVDMINLSTQRDSLIYRPPAKHHFQ